MAQAIQVESLQAGVSDSSGVALDSGTATFYETDGTTLKTIWADSGKAAKLSNPVTLGSAGEKNVFADGTYNIVIEDSSGSTVYNWNSNVFNPNDPTALPYIDASSFATDKDESTLSLAITDAAGADRTIYLEPGDWTITDDLTIPANINLKIEMGAYCTVSSGKTLTINGVIEAPLTNIFRGAGTVTIENRNFFIPSIWLISGTHDNATLDGVISFPDIVKVSTDGTAIGAAGSVTLGAGADTGVYWDGSNMVLGQTTALTNTIQHLNLEHITSGTPANGIGTGVKFITETSASNNEIGMLLEAVTTDVSAASEDFDFVVKLMAGGSAAAETFRVSSAGNVTFTGSLSDGTATLDGTGTWTGVVSLTSTTITDGTATLTGGAWTGITSATVDNLVINGNDIGTSSGNLTLTPVAGSAVVIDGAASFDAGVVTGITSLTSTTITDGTATLTGGAWTGITSATVDNLVINGNDISSSTGNITLTPTSDVVISDGTIDFDVASHDGTNGLKLGGTLVTSTATELNLLDGVTATTAELNLLDGVTATTAELNYVDVATAGTVEASKAIIVDSSKEVFSLGKVVLGHTAALPLLQDSCIQSHGTGGEVGLSASRWSNSTAPPSITLGKSRGASVGTNAIVQSGDDLGIIYFTGDDGTDVASIGAEIGAVVDGTPGVNDMPGKLEFRTTSDGSNSTTLRLTIDKSGDVYSVGLTDYYSSSTVNGLANLSETKIWYKRIGNLVWVHVDLAGDSDGTAFNVTLPYNTVHRLKAVGKGIDAGTSTFVSCDLGPTDNFLEFFPSAGASGSWTNSSTRGIDIQFWYETNDAI